MMENVENRRKSAGPINAAFIGMPATHGGACLNLKQALNACSLLTDI